MEQEYAKTTSKRLYIGLDPLPAVFAVGREGGTYHVLFRGDGGVLLADAVIL